MPIVLDQPISVGSPGWTRWDPTDDIAETQDLPSKVSISIGAVVAVSEDTTAEKSILIGTIPHPALRLRAPLRVEIERQGGEVAVWSSDLEESGYGSHLTAAIEDFQRSIVELYLALAAQQDDLGPAMYSLWKQINSVIEPRL